MEGVPASLETLIDKAGGAVNLLRGSNLGPYVFPGIPAEFTNLRAEQRAWRDGVALLEQCYHMTELHLHGTVAVPFLSEFALNKLNPFEMMPKNGRSFRPVTMATLLQPDCLRRRVLRVVGALGRWSYFDARAP